MNPYRKPAIPNISFRCECRSQRFMGKCECVVPYELTSDTKNILRNVIWDQIYQRYLVRDIDGKWKPEDGQKLPIRCLIFPLDWHNWHRSKNV